MTDKCPSAAKFLAAVILAAGIAASGYLVNQGLIYFRSFDRSVSVKGLATQEVEADLVLWPLKHTATGNDLPAAQQTVDDNTQKILTFLKKQGIGESDIVYRNIEVTDLLAQAYRSENIQDSRYIVSETITVRTGNVEAVTKAAQNIGELLKQGVSLSQDNNGGQSTGKPEYIYTKLNDIKPEMIAQATKNARAGAQQFASDSGAKVGAIRSASQGMFEILPRDSDSGYLERQSRYKTVRVVSTIQFYLE